MQASDRVIAAARKIVASQRRARELKQSVAWSRCELVREGIVDDVTGEVLQAGIAPCPFHETKNADEWDFEFSRMKESAWCDPCRENWRLHGEWRAERARRTGFLRTLENAVTAMEKAEEKQ